MAKKQDVSPKGRALIDLGRKWLDRIEAAGKAEKNFLDDALVATKAYTGEGNKVEKNGVSGRAYDFNILYANVETIVPAVINSAPVPDIRRRFGNDDPVARDLAQIIERAIQVQTDDSKLQVELEAMAQDGFLAGRGIIRMRFMSDFVGGETTDDELREAEKAEQPNYSRDDDTDDEQPQPEPEETAINERITFEAVSWRDYRHGPSKRWDTRPWDAFRHTIASEDYGGFVDKDLVTLQAEDGTSTATANDCEVWEVWDKRTRSVLFVDAGTAKILKRVPDPLGLSQFFPIATPVQPIEVNGRLMPVNPFSIYRKLADELDATTKRIGVITKQLQVKGWYGISPTDVQAVLDASDNEFVPISDAEIWAKNGGLQSAVLFWPVEKLIIVLAQLYGVREQTKQAIYEVTGISDIVRGASKAQETAAAQQLKSQWGSLRIQKMQRMIERAARDLFVMMSEVIPAKFSAQTLERMTGIQIVPAEADMTPATPQIPPNAPPEVAQQAQAQAQQAEQKRQARLQHLMQLQALMREKASMYYRVDVETDSTIRSDVTAQKQEATQFMQAASGYFAAVAPLVQQGALPMNLAVEIFGSISRLFNLGRTVEDAIDELVSNARSAADQPPPQKPDPKAEAEAAEQKRKADQAQAELQIKVQNAEVDRKIKLEDAAMDSRIKGTQLQIEQAKLAMLNRQLAMQQFGAGVTY